MVVAFIATVCFAVRVERKIAKGEIPLVPYSFKALWKFGWIMAVVSAFLALLIYWQTNDSSFSLSCLVIFVALTCVGLLRGLLAEYQHKRRGGNNLDEEQ